MQFSKKIGVNFLFGKNTEPGGWGGGGSEGGLVKDYTFSGFFLNPQFVLSNKDLHHFMKMWMFTI